MVVVVTEEVCVCLWRVNVSSPFLHQQNDSEEDDDEEQDSGTGAGNLDRVV